MRKDCCPACDPTSHGRTDNPPGLDAIRFRCGTHASFLQAMLDRVSVSAHTGSGPNPSRPLDGLRTREPSDPAIAWLDAWATVAEILAFYQERLANEGYLRTAREERSVAELARLVGYRPRPGVSASCHLAFTLEQGHTVEIPAGTRVQSTPGPQELPQTFETSATIEARAAWSTMRARRTRPQHIPPGQSRNVVEIYLKGLTLDLKPNDLLLLEYPEQSVTVVRRIESATPEPPFGWTHIKLQLDSISVVSLGTSAWTVLKSHQNQGASQNIGAERSNKANEVRQSVIACDTALETAIREESQLHKLDGAVTHALGSYHNLLSGAGPILALGKGFNDLRTKWDSLVTAIGAAIAAAPKALNDELERDNAGKKEGLVPAYIETDRLIKAFLDKLDTNTSVGDAKAAVEDLSSHVSGRSPKSLVVAVAAAKNTLELLSEPTLGNNATGIKNGIQGFYVQAVENAATARLNDLVSRVKQADNWDAKAKEVDRFLAPDGGMADLEHQALPNLNLKDRLSFLKASLSSVDGVRGPIRTALNGFPTSPNELHQLVKSVATLKKNYETKLDPAKNKAGQSVWEAKVAALWVKNQLTTGQLADDAGRLDEQATGCQNLHDTVSELVTSIIDIQWRSRVDVGIAIYGFGTRYATLLGNADVKTEIDDLIAWFTDGSPKILDANGNKQPVPADPKKLADRSLTDLVAKLGERLPALKEKRNSLTGEPRRLADGLVSELELLQFQLGATRDTRHSSTPPLSAGLVGLFDLLNNVRPPATSRMGGVSASGVFAGILDALHNERGRAPDLFARLAPLAQGKDMDAIFAAWRSVRFEDPMSCRVFVLRQKTALFGYNAPKVAVPNKPDPSEWNDPAFNEHMDSKSRLFLADALDRVSPGSHVVVYSAGAPANPLRVAAATVQPRTDYGLSTRVTKLDIADGKQWYTEESKNFSLLRTTFVYAQSERLELCEMPIRQEPGQLEQDSEESRTGSLNYAVAEDEIELDDLVAGLTIGREVLLQGERTDLTGVIEAEPKVIRAVTHAWREVDGDTPHTILKFDGPIGARRGTVAAAPISYKRDSVVVYGNVVRATHGETQREILGSGDARVPFQTFDLKVAPLTHLAAATVPGAEPVVEVRVDGVRWQRVDDLVELGPHDRGYVVRIGDTQQASVIFGDGRHGAKPPTGSANIQAAYRSGLGQTGNLGAGRVNQLRDRPLGLKSVVNPLAASGGADREGRDQVRGNAPLGTRALGRLVAVEDYADFARSFAGIAKAAAVPLPGPRQPVIHVTIAGQDDAVILEDSDLYRNLLEAFSRLGNPQQSVVLQTRHQITLVLAASIRVAADYQWSSVEPRLRAALLAEFGFARRELGLAVTASEVLAALHAAPGVAYADLDVFGGIREFHNAAEAQEQFGRLQQQAASSQAAAPCVTVLPARYGHDGRYCAAEIAYLAAGFPELFLLTEVRT